MSKAIEFSLWHIIYSVKDKQQYSTALKTFARKNNLDETTFIESFIKYPPFKNEYGAYSEKAVKKLLPLMRMGKFWNEDEIPCELTNETWEVQIEYIPKRKGEFLVYFDISEIETTELQLEYKECMEGDPIFGAKAIWKENQFNRIYDFFPNYSLKKNFGIIVE